MIYSEEVLEMFLEEGKCVQPHLLLGIRVMQPGTSALGNTVNFTKMGERFGL